MHNHLPICLVLYAEIANTSRLLIIVMAQADVPNRRGDICAKVLIQGQHQQTQHTVIYFIPGCHGIWTFSLPEALSHLEKSQPCSVTAIEF